MSSLELLLLTVGALSTLASGYVGFYSLGYDAGRDQAERLRALEIRHDDCRNGERARDRTGSPGP